MNEIDQEFEDHFWPAYPRKVKKGAARTAYRKARTKTTLAVMLAALAWQTRTPQWRDCSKGPCCFVPYPATWLNGEQWEDEAPAAPSQRQQYTLTPEHAARIRQQREAEDEADRAERLAEWYRTHPHAPRPSSS